MHQFTRLLLFMLLGLHLACSSESSKEAADTKSVDPAKIVEHSKISGAPMNYVTCGQGDTTLLFVHGWGIDKSYWSEQMKALCPQYRVIAVDLPGFHDGDTLRTDWSIPALASDIQALMDLLELENVVLIGHSMGGSVILEVAVSKPNAVIGFIGVDNFKDVGVEQDKETVEAIAQFFDLLANDYVGTATYYANTYLFHEQTDTFVKQRVVNDISTSHPGIAISTLRLLFDYGPRELPNFEKLKHKVFLLNSDGSPTDISHLEAAGVSVEVISVGTTGHYPMIENPAFFNTQLKTVLEKI